jgi:hypothetical protein
MIQNGQKKDILDILLEINDKKGENLEDGDIIDLLITLLFTGHETTAIAVMWSITYLTKNPLCLKKARVYKSPSCLYLDSFNSFFVYIIVCVCHCLYLAGRARKNHESKSILTKAIKY